MASRRLMSESGPNNPMLVFEDWGPKVVEGVPFALVDPQGDRVPNALLLNGPRVSIPTRMPKSVTLPVNAPAKINNGKTDVPSVLLEPIVVDKNNLDETVIKDGFQKREDVYKLAPKASADIQSSGAGRELLARARF